MAYPSSPYKPYAAEHENLNGPDDDRPSSLKVLQDCNALGKLKGQTVLITGCSAGIGVETAKALYEAGATLFLTARDMPKLEKIIDDIVSKAEHNKGGSRPQGIEIELNSLDSVRKGAEDFKHKSGGKLNMLINNAGVMACPYSQTKDGFETQIGVNHFAHFLLFQLLKPLLISSAKESGVSSRVINLSSAGHRRSTVTFTDAKSLEEWNKGEGYEKWTAYGQSKTANIHMANAIDRRYGSKGVHAWSVHPGGIRTDLGRHLDQQDFERMGIAQDTMAKIYKSPSQGAATTVWAAVSPHFEGQNGGRYLADVGETAPAGENPTIASSGYTPWAYDQEGEERLWKISCEAVGVEDDA